MAARSHNEFPVISLYDFESTSDVELGFKEGETLLVVRRDVGGGWWEGRRPEDHKIGLFPASYVKIVEQSSAGQEVADKAASVTSRPSHQMSDELADDDFVAVGDIGNGEGDFSAGQHLPVTNGASFNSLVAAGSGILNSQHRCRIVVGPRWESDVEALRITVQNPQKDSKLSGMKQFITYEVLSDVSTEPVKRRYKHFLWLHEQLSELFPGICIPPLPEKQFTGRFEEEFIKIRKQLLEVFLNNVARHSLLAASHVFSHFLTASGEREWKSGKQMVRKSVALSKPHGKNLGAAFLNDFMYPTNNVPHDRTALVDRCTKFRDCLERNMKILCSSCDQLSTSTKVMSEAVATVGESLTGLAVGDGYASQRSEGDGELSHRRSTSSREDKRKTSDGSIKRKHDVKAVKNWCWRKDCAEFAQMMQAVHVFGSGLNSVTELLKTQSEQTNEILTGSLRDQIGLLQCLPTVLQAYKDAADHYSTLQSRSAKHSVESILSGSKYEETMANVMMAEFDYYHHWFLHSLQKMMSDFIKKQVELHQKLLAEWLNHQVAFESTLSGGYDSFMT